MDGEGGNLTCLRDGIFSQMMVDVARAASLAGKKGRMFAMSEELKFVIESPWVLLAMPCANQLGADQRKNHD